MRNDCSLVKVSGVRNPVLKARIEGQYIREKKKEWCSSLLETYRHLHLLCVTLSAAGLSHLSLVVSSPKVNFRFDIKNNYLKQFHKILLFVS